MYKPTHRYTYFKNKKIIFKCEEVKITGIFLESNLLATAHFAADKGSEVLLNDLASSASPILVHPPRQNPVT